MKRVHIKEGLKQRLNEILGTDDSLTPDPTNPELKQITPWSVQAAMISNLLRLARSIVGLYTVGRPMEGMGLTNPSGIIMAIGSGIGITKNGNMVVLENPIQKVAEVAADETRYLYVRHKIAEVDGSDDDGRLTNLVGKSGQVEMVYDDFAASKKGDISAAENRDEILVDSPTQINDDEYLVYIGSYTTSGGSVSGVFPNTDTNVLGLNVAEDLSVDGKLEAEGNVTIQGTTFSVDKITTLGGINLASGILQIPSTLGSIEVGGIQGDTASYALTGGGTLTVKNGIVTDYSP